MRIFIVDDHSLFRDGILSLLEAAGYSVVGQAGDGQSALEQIEILRPELVLLDIHMPGMSGLEVLKTIKSSWPEIGVVMLTVSEAEADLIASIRAGAEGFLLKHLSTADFFKMLEGVKMGEAAISRKSAAVLMKSISHEKVSPEAPVDPFSEREIEIMQFLVQGLSNKFISDRLSVSENTVKYHIKNILRKLNVQNRTEAVMRALQMKLL
jgi:DNA-binding NarL/FixJ family response regulator